MENTNEQIIKTFYEGFKNKNYQVMQNCYTDNATFNDEVFVNLSAKQVRAMWQMLITRGKDLNLEFSNIKADEKSGSAEWIATYTFSTSGKKVTNKIKASFLFENGKIIKHTDQFDFYKWSRQAFGSTGLLLGWTPFFKNKVRKQAAKNLSEFMREA